MKRSSAALSLKVPAYSKRLGRVQCGFVCGHAKSTANRLRSASEQ